MRVMFASAHKAAPTKRGWRGASATSCWTLNPGGASHNYFSHKLNEIDYVLIHYRYPGRMAPLRPRRAAKNLRPEDRIKGKW